MCVCVCVCVRERKGMRECIVFVCVCISEEHCMREAEKKKEKEKAIECEGRLAPSCSCFICLSVCLSVLSEVHCLCCC